MEAPADAIARAGATRLSVVIPVYNGARTLDRTLRSLILQDRLDALEIVAVDQASSDGSRGILESYRDRLPLRIVSAPDGKNWMQTTNAGLRAARAPLVSMLHQDDLWMPGRAGAMLALAERHPDATLWLHPAWFVDERDRRIGRFGPPFGGRERRIEPPEALRSLLVQNTIALPAAMFRRDMACDRGGLSDALWYTADWDLWLDLARQGPIAWLPRRLAGFRIHAGSQTVRGSRDLADFAEQLAIPRRRHRAALADPQRRRTEALAAAAAEINVFLAARYHGTRASPRPLLASLLRVGPHRWAALLRHSQIVPRTLPRLRALLARSGARREG